MPKVILKLPYGSRVEAEVCADATVGTLNYILKRQSCFDESVTYTRQGDKQSKLCPSDITTRLYDRDERYHPEEDVWQVQVVSVSVSPLTLQNFVSVGTCIGMVGSDEEDAASNVATAGNDKEDVKEREKDIVETTDQGEVQFTVYVASNS